MGCVGQLSAGTTAPCGGSRGSVPRWRRHARRTATPSSAPLQRGQRLFHVLAVQVQCEGADYGGIGCPAGCEAATAGWAGRPQSRPAASPTRRSRRRWLAARAAAGHCRRQSQSCCLQSWRRCCWQAGLVRAQVPRVAPPANTRRASAAPAAAAPPPPPPPRPAAAAARPCCLRSARRRVGCRRACAGPSPPPAHAALGTAAAAGTRLWVQRRRVGRRATALPAAAQRLVATGRGAAQAAHAAAAAGAMLHLGAGQRRLMGCVERHARLLLLLLPGARPLRRQQGRQAAGHVERFATGRVLCRTLGKPRLWCRSRLDTLPTAAAGLPPWLLPLLLRLRHAVHSQHCRPAAGHSWRRRCAVSWRRHLLNHCRGQPR